MVSNELRIESYFHCGKCLDEMPGGFSPREWAQLEAGWTVEGIQIWCRRHECNVMHMDFQGHQHPADTTIHSDPPILRLVEPSA